MKKSLRWIVVYKVLPILRDRGLNGYANYGEDVRIQDDHGDFLVLGVNRSWNKIAAAYGGAGICSVCKRCGLDAVVGRDGSIIVEKAGSGAYQNFLGSIVT